MSVTAFYEKLGFVRSEVQWSGRVPQTLTPNSAFNRTRRHAG